MRRKSINIHERFLRHIWDKQYLRSELKTSDGFPVKVFYVGQYNPDGGPDFKNAKIKIGATTYAGDVEIHRTVFDWIQHQHQEDPKYNSVILHVVLEADGSIPPTLANSGRQIPVLVLGQFLSESIHTIWQKAILDERTKKSESIKCFNHNNYIETSLIEKYFEKLSVERLEIKLRRFEERLKQLAQEKKMTIYEKQQLYGKEILEESLEEIPPPLPELTQKDYSSKELWEQVLYEGIMECLGYSKNREPFLRLAKNLTLIQIKNFRLETGDQLEAALFGISGLLPKVSEIQETNARLYIRKLKKQWNNFRPQYKGEILHKADWQFFPTRPTNFPTIRLAAAKEIIMSLLSNNPLRKIIQIEKEGLPAKDKIEKLNELFTIETSNFWKNHYYFNLETSGSVCPLGMARINEIIINAILPISLLYARTFKDKDVREGVLNVYCAMPGLESNSIIRLMEKQLLKNRLKVNSVCRHQAIIQLYKYYCSENRCADCEIGKALQIKPTHF